MFVQGDQLKKEQKEAKNAQKELERAAKIEEKAAKEKQNAFFNLVEDLKEKLRNMLTEHKLWEDKVDKIIKSSDSEETKVKERQKVLELIGRVDKSENEFEVFREMFQQVFFKSKFTLCLAHNLKLFNANH